MALNHTPIALNAPGNSSTVNSPLAELDAAMGDVSTITIASTLTDAVGFLNSSRLAMFGGATVSNNVLIGWTESGAYQLSNIAYHGTYTNTISTADVVWQDGATGTFTVTDYDADLEAVDAYTITHSLSGKTVTQASVTRNADGAITLKPNLSVA